MDRYTYMYVYILIVLLIQVGHADIRAALPAEAVRG